MLQPGDRPDDFELLDQHGQTVQWSSYRGKPVVVFFYPRASTPGCTTEACDFRDLGAEFGALGAAVIGVSADKVSAQARFDDKHGLGMPLLSDPEHRVLAPWGVWGEKKMYGKTHMGIRRSTFLFDAEGVVIQAWTNVRVKGHADKVLDALRGAA